jgi:hypothetical protein
MNFKCSSLRVFDSNQFLENARSYCTIGPSFDDGSGPVQLLGQLHLGWQPRCKTGAEEPWPLAHGRQRADQSGDLLAVSSAEKGGYSSTATRGPD